MKLQQGILVTALLLVLSFALGNFTGTAKSADTLEVRLQKLEDIEAIRSLLIAVNGDSATAWSRWTWVVVGANGKPQAERAGYYEDVLTRQNGEWMFKSRQAFTEINP